MSKPEPEPTISMVADDGQRVREILDRARAGDREVLPQLSAVLDDHPEVWGWYSDLARAASESWVGVLAGEDLLIAESLRRRAEALCEELTGDSP